MLRVRIAEALPGMVLALPLHHPKRPGTMLLKADARLDRRNIARLLELGVREMWIRYPNLEIIAEVANSEVLAAHGELTRRVAAAFDPVITDSHAHLDFAEARRAIAGLVEQLISSPRSGVYVQEVLDSDESVSRHASNVCVLSLLMGLKLDEYLISERSRLSSSHARDVTSLGVGAMLHDVGMLRLDDAAIDRWNRTQDESDPDWQRHVEIGYELVRGEIGPSAAVIIRHHHQCFDGSGFPARSTPEGDVPLAGQAIHVFARIAAVADMFDRLRFQGEHFGSAGPGMIPRVRALRMILDQPLIRRFDPIAIRGLLRVVPPYPPGEVVRLSTGAQAVVVDWTPDDPCRPVVQCIDLDSCARGDGAAIGEPIDLRESTGVEIAEAEGHNVRNDNFAVCWEKGRPELVIRRVAQRS